MSDWHWPQWTFAALYALRIVVASVCDGQPLTGKTSLSQTMLGVAIGAFTLWAAGFWGGAQ